MRREYRIRFLPVDRIFPAEEGDNLLEIAMRAGVHINASCGGRGVCGKCRVRIAQGTVNEPVEVRLDDNDRALGFHLACSSLIKEDITVEVPLESQIDRTILSRPVILRDSETAKANDARVEQFGFEPPVARHYLELPRPDIDDNISDTTRLVRELAPRIHCTEAALPLGVIRGMASRLRDADWKVTVNVSRIDGMPHITAIEKGDRTDDHYAIAIDIGTTTITADLIGLSSQSRSPRIVASASDYNAQISYGEDVISRIMYCRKPDGLARLQEVVAATLNKLIAEVGEQSGIESDNISHIIVAGNTTMMHLFYGIDPRYIMLEPYTPVTNTFDPAYAIEVGLKTGKDALLYSIPGVASYVGGDIVSGIALSGMTEHHEISLFMDIGTNGEIALGNSEWVLCASCSAGPAFEGGGIEFGMRASPGAIEKVSINPVTCEPMILTIDRKSPLGICGSGLIDLVAELVVAGIIDRNGKFTSERAGRHLRRGVNGMEYVLCFASETGIERDIVINEIDLDNIMRTKAAVYAGCRVLMESGGVAFFDLGRVVIAGGFGHSIDVEKAIMIGLLPELPAKRFQFMGNASLGGARAACASTGFFEKAKTIARSMTNIELSNNARFMDEFMAAMFLPHTDDKSFPETLKKLRVFKVPGEK
ncbi:MAG: ASKHA domain-containing protein [Syntrophorhabdaceae bacterium]